MFKSILILTTIFLSACSQTTGIDAARNKGISSNPFFDTLRVGYIDLADEQWKNGNKKAAKHYGNKATAIAKGIYPKPDILDIKEIPSANFSELSSARGFVMKIMTSKIQEKDPLTTANLQISFDCWVNQELNFSKQNNLSCKKAYKNDEAIVKQRISGGKAIRTSITNNQPPISGENKIYKDIKPRIISAYVPIEKFRTDKNMPEPYEIFFNINSSKLNFSSLQTLEKAAIEALKFRPKKILIKGNTDRSGTLHGNRVLAAKRANAVAKVLMKHGIPLNMLDIRSYGASTAWVDKTASNTDERYRNTKVIFLSDNKIRYR
jgi:outer membrane protein OmpA-like peptidoglycan-associated protein